MKVLLFLLLFIPASLQAQNRFADSLETELLSAKTDSEKIVLNCNLSKHYLFTDAKKAKAYALTAKKMATAIDFAYGNAKALNLLGNSHLIMGEYDKAMRCQYKSLEIGKQIQDTAIQITAYLNLGTIYHKIKDPDRALRNYAKASRLAREKDDNLSLSKIYNNIGNIYEEQAKYKQALNIFNKAAKLQEKYGDKTTWAIVLHNIGNVHLYLNQPQKGLPYLFKSVQINQEIGNDMILMTTLGKIALLYQAMGNDSLALKYAQQSFDMATKVESSKKIAEAAQLLHEIYASKGNYEMAYKYLIVYTKHNEILNGENRTRIESELTVKYETEQKELENQRLKADTEKQATQISQQRYILLLGGTAVLLMVLMLVVLLISKQRLRAAFTKLKEAHELMQTQQVKIIAQKNKISSQATKLQKQNQELEKHIDFRNKVFSIISHDLRNPFNSIKGVLSLAHVRNLPANEVQNIFGLLDKNMDIALNMLDNVLIWAKTQLEEATVELQTVDLFLVAEENIALVKPHAENKKIALLNAINKDALAMADKERLNFVLRNLLMNAIKFSFPGGEILLQVQAQDEEVILAVSDNGKGISADKLSTLFSEKRFSTMGTSGEKGTGLGLMLCKELLESMRGTIRVESIEGKGSTFYISLPKAKILAEA